MTKGSLLSAVLIQKKIPPALPEEADIRRYKCGRQNPAALIFTFTVVLPVHCSRNLLGDFWHRQLHGN